MFFMCFSGISNVVISHVFYLHVIWISWVAKGDISHIYRHQQGLDIFLFFARLQMSIDLI